MYAFDYKLKNKIKFFFPFRNIFCNFKLVESMTRIKNEKIWFHFTLFILFIPKLLSFSSDACQKHLRISGIFHLRFKNITLPSICAIFLHFVLLRTFHFYFAKRNRFLLFSDADIDCPYFLYSSFTPLFVVLKDIRSDRLLLEQKIELVLVLHQMRNRLRFRSWNISSEFFPIFLLGCECIWYMYIRRI